MDLKKVLLGIVFTGLFVGCASIPPEAPELSKELGKTISSLESANMKLLHKYFDEKRSRVDKYIEKEWVPEFAKKVFSKPKISKAWDIIVKEDNKSDRLKFLIVLGPKLQSMINRQRVKMVSELNSLEKLLEEKIRQEYTQAKSMNNTITGLLISTSEITENRDRYLDMFGVTNEKINSVIDKTDDAISSLVEKSEDLPEKVEKANNFIEKIKKIKSSI